MEPYKWKVVPITPEQKLDVNPVDLLVDGDFRRCNTYKGGGGYDHFPTLAEKYFGENFHNLQFIVQLFGCNLDCPYCYVTRNGVWSQPKFYTSADIVKHFNESDCTVLHLMGGAPALYLGYWSDIIDELENNGKANWLFHSDLMLTERQYNNIPLSIAHERSLYAVNIKGVTPETYRKNTRKDLDEYLFWENLQRLEWFGINFYITFTNIPEEEINMFWDLYPDKNALSKRKEEAYSINLINYNALPYVDSVEWGPKHEK